MSKENENHAPSASDAIIYITPKGNKVMSKDGQYFLENGNIVELDLNPEELGWKTETEIQNKSKSGSVLAKPIPSAANNARKFIAPMGSNVHDRVTNSMIEKEIPVIPSEIAGAVAGLPFYAADAASYAFSPAGMASKAIGSYVKVLPEAIVKIGNALKNSKIAAAAKNVTQNTADAAFINNAQRLAEGEDLSFGSPEIIGGMVGGGIKTRGDFKLDKDIKKFAPRNNANMNFAQRTTGKKGTQAIEEVIEKNLKPGEDFRAAALRLRKEQDALDEEFYKHFKEVNDMVYDVSPRQIRENLDDYVIENTTDLGLEFASKVSATMNDAYNDLLRSVLKNRIVKSQGMSQTKALDAVRDMQTSEVYDRLGNLTLGEVDYIKRGMQKRTSHYNRGAGTMERQGLESLSNKEGSEGILSELGNFVENNKMLTPQQKAEKIQMMEEGLEVGVADFAKSIDERLVKVLKANNIASADDISKYMNLNKERSRLIGTERIMNGAADKYEFLNIGKLNITHGLNEFNKFSSDRTGAASRAAANRYEEYQNSQILPEEIK